VNEMIILKHILKKRDVTMWIGFIWLRTGVVASSCEHGNELSGSIKSEKNTYWVNHYQPLKCHSAA